MIVNVVQRTARIVTQNVKPCRPPSGISRGNTQDGHLAAVPWGSATEDRKRETGDVQADDTVFQGEHEL